MAIGWRLLPVVLALVFAPARAAFPAFDTTLAWTLVNSDWTNYPDVVAHFAHPLYEIAPDLIPVHQVGPGQTPGASTTTKSALFAVTNAYKPATATSVLLAVYTYSADTGFSLSSLRVLDADETRAFFSEATNDAVLASYISDVELTVDGSASQCTPTGSALLLDQGDEAVHDFLYPSNVTVEGAEDGQVNMLLGCNLILYSTSMPTHYFSKNVPYNESCILVATPPVVDVTYKTSSVCSTPELLTGVPIDSELTGEAAKHAKASAFALLVVGYLGNNELATSRASVYVPSVSFYPDNHFAAQVTIFYEPTGYFESTNFQGAYATTDSTYTITALSTSTEEIDTDQNTVTRCFNGNYTAFPCTGDSRVLIAASRGTTVNSLPCAMPIVRSPCPPSPAVRSPAKEQWVEWRDAKTSAAIGVVSFTIFTALVVVLLS